MAKTFRGSTDKSLRRIDATLGPRLWCVGDVFGLEPELESTLSAQRRVLPYGGLPAPFADWVRAYTPRRACELPRYTLGVLTMGISLFAQREGSSKTVPSKEPCLPEGDAEAGSTTRTPLSQSGWQPCS